MAVETKTALRQETIDALQELIQTNIDSRDGFRYSAEKIEDLTIASFFEQMAEEREQQANELSRFVQYNGEQPDRSGSYAAAVHRGWLAVREAVSTCNPYAVLAEAERGEDQIKRAYEKALREEPGSAMNDVLTQQYAQVKSAHDRVRDLRDSYKEC
jgi:uncharacterized protein (TIGR02284 family)